MLPQSPLNHYDDQYDDCQPREADIYLHKAGYQSAQT